jgi:hypothetical protein
MGILLERSCLISFQTVGKIKLKIPKILALLPNSTIKNLAEQEFFIRTPYALVQKWT